MILLTMLLLVPYIGSIALVIAINGRSAASLSRHSGRLYGIEVL